MPLGPLTISAGPGAVADALRSRLPVTNTTDTPDIAVCSGPPDQMPGHLIITGHLTEALDEWDQEVAPQTLAGALWLVPEQVDAGDAAVAWVILRTQTPATPLSDLTDNNGRALRWSVAVATTVVFPQETDVQVDAEEVKAWVDAQPEVKELGEAVQRIGGETGESVLNSVLRLRSALTGLSALGATAAPTPALDAAVAEHLRQVQRSGFGRWRAAKARAASLAGLQQAAKEVSGPRLQEVLDARRAQMADDLRTQRQADTGHAQRQAVEDAVAALTLPTVVDFSKSPRSWSNTPPAPRRYAFVHEDHLEQFAGLSVTVWAADIPRGQALCALVQSGFSLPAVR